MEYTLIVLIVGIYTLSTGNILIKLKVELNKRLIRIYGFLLIILAYFVPSYVEWFQGIFLKEFKFITSEYYLIIDIFSIFCLLSLVGSVVHFIFENKIEKQKRQKKESEIIQPADKIEAILNNKNLVKKVFTISCIVFIAALIFMILFAYLEISNLWIIPFMSFSLMGIVLPGYILLRLNSNDNENSKKL